MFALIKCYSLVRFKPYMKLFLYLSVAAMSASSVFAAQWNVDPAHSNATFAIKHMMVSTVRGSFSGLKGTVDYDPTISPARR